MPILINDLTLVDYCFHINEALAVANFLQALEGYGNRNILGSLLTLSHNLCLHLAFSVIVAVREVIQILAESLFNHKMNMNVSPRMPSLPGRIPRGSLVGILAIMRDYKEPQTGQLCPESSIHEVYDNDVEIRDREGLSKL